METSREVDMVAFPHPDHQPVMPTTTDQPGAPLPGGYSRGLEAAEIGLWRWDLATGTLGLSPRAAAQLGCSHSQSLNYAGFIGLIHPDDRLDADKALQDSVAAIGSFDFDFRTATTGLWLRARGQVFGAPLLDAPLAGAFLSSDQRGPAEAAGILIDAGRIASTEEINSRLAAIVTSSDDAIIGEALDGTVTDWNRGAETVFGHAAAEIIGKSIAILASPGLEQETQDILDRLKRGERIDHFETQRRRKDGAIIDLSLTVSPLYDRMGRLVGTSMVARDITAARQAQIALRESEAHLRSVLDTVPDAMIVIDNMGIMRSFSATAERLFGFTAGEAIGQNVSLLMPSPYREQHDTYLKRYFATGERKVIGRGRIVVGLRNDGSTFPMELTVGEMISDDRSSFTGFVRDLTERQETQRRLQDLQAELIHMSRFTAMGEMASSLAHELNQPLTAVASYLNGCRRLLDGSESVQNLMLRDAIDRAAEQALRAGQIIRRLRQFVARGESERQVENLTKLIEEASALALVGVKETGVRVVFALDPRARFVLADKIQLQQVLLNLMRNAIEAMHETTRRQLTISTIVQPGDGVEIRVTDTGSGIAPEIAAQLFQPFVTTKPNGMGVGLSISRTIVEAHGGCLLAEPNPEGGTIFRLTLKTLNKQELTDGD